MRPPPTSRGPQLDPDIEGLVVVGLAGVAVTLYVSAAGATILGAALTGHGWVDAGWADHGRALVSLPWHLDDPATGYPDTVAAAVPGPVVWWTLAVLLVAGIAGAALWVGLAGSRGRGRGGWARRRDLRALRSRSDGVVLGMHGGRAIAVEARHSTLVIGATQTHKTTGLAVPAILEADDLAVIALSVKDDIVSDTIGWRSTLPGHHWLFDPTGVFDARGTVDAPVGLGGDAARRLALRSRIVQSGWSPLALATTWQGALATAFDLTRSGAAADAGADGENKFFYDSAEALIACYLYAAANEPTSTMRTVVRWVAQRACDEVQFILAGLDSQEAYGHFEGIWCDDRKTLSNIFSTARLLVGAWLDPTVAASSERCDIDPVAFFNGAPNTLYLVAPPSNQDRLRVVFNLLVKQFVDHAYAQVLATGRPLDRRVLIIVDELANIAPIPNLGTIASTAASQGLQLVSIVQDLSQLRSRYGADDAGTIVNNHRALLLLSGVKDVATLELASKLLGTRRESHLSIRRDGWGRRTRTESSRDVAVAPIEALREQGRGSGTLIYGNLRGAELKLRPWFEHRRLARRARHVPRGSNLINPLPDSGDHVRAGGVMTAYDDWIGRDPTRRAADVDFGTTWTRDRDPDDTWRLSWNTGSGELVAVNRAADDVEVLGTFATVEDVRDTIPDWPERAVRPGGLDELRRDLAEHERRTGWAPPVLGIVIRPDGSTSRLHEPVTIDIIEQHVGSDALDLARVHPNLTSGRPLHMIVDDLGHAKGLQVNPLATLLYGSGWPILGTAVLFDDNGDPLPRSLSEGLNTDPVAAVAGPGSHGIAAHHRPHRCSHDIGAGEPEPTPGIDLS